MKISIIGPGIMPIPPTGWGAVEILIWDMKLALESLGHTIQIVNTQNGEQILSELNSFQPDFVHVQYDEFIGFYPHIPYPKAITSHYGYLEQPDKYGGYVAMFDTFKSFQPNVFCLSEQIRQIYLNLINIPDEKLFVVPNGVNCDNFKFTHSPEHPDRSIYLAKIDFRKRQHMFQSINSLWYAGNIADHRFDTSKNYLGEWNKQYLYENLTHYGNLVLLSDGEAHPLVCMEALAAGLGVVVCQWGAANLDSSKPFIDVIPESKIGDIQYIEDTMIRNREYSVAHRDEILEYSKQFDWRNVLQQHYIPNIMKVINQV